MEFWYALIGIVAVIALFPYIRCFFKRLKCAYKIKRLCRSKNYKIHVTHPLWFLGSKHAKKCDLYIETANEVFAVKLFGMPRRLSILILKENGEYFIRSFIALISYGGGIRFPINGKPKPMPAYNFRYKYRDEWESPCLLIISDTNTGMNGRSKHRGAFFWSILFRWSSSDNRITVAR